jgi:hypothetical protein
VVYDPGDDYQYLAEGETASVELSYTMSDNHGGESVSTVTLSVTGVNDAPTAIDDDLSGGGGGSGNVRVAVVYQSGGSHVAATVNQLNDSTEFSFQVDAVFYTDADSLTELQNYDAVVHAGNYWDDYSADYWSALSDYVASDEGGVVTTGWFAYTLAYDLPYQGDADFVTPISPAGYYNQYLGSPSIMGGHSVTDGISSLPNAGNHVEAARGVDAGSVILGNLYGSNSYAAIVAKDGDDSGQGNTLYLGGLYTESGYYDPVLRSGAWDQLLEQGINWAAGGGSGGALTNEDSATTISAADILNNDEDPDASDVLVISDVSPISVSGASVTLGGDGNVQYDPSAVAEFQALALGETATDSFQYRVSDGHVDSNWATVTFTVRGTNDGPVAVADSGGTDEDTTVTIDVLANDTDVDLSDTHTVDAVSVTSGGGSASIVGNQVVFDPGADYQYLAVGETASVVLAYTMSDNNDAQSSSTISLTITGTNDGPVAEDDLIASGSQQLTDVDQTGGSNNTLSTAQMVTRGDFGYGANADVGDDSQPWVSVDGYISPNSDVDFYGFELNAGETITLDVDYAMNQGVSMDSTLGFFNAAGNALSVNDDTSYGTGGGGSIHGYDSYISYTVSTAGIYYAGVASYANFPNGSAGSYSGNGYYSGDYVLNVSLNPIGGISGGGGTDEDTAIDIDVLANDTDVDASDVLSVFSFDGSSANGAAVSLNGDGTLHYEPGDLYQYLAVDETVSDTFAYTVTDGNGGFDSATVSLTIVGTNDGPVALADTGSTDEDNSVTINVLANDTDVDLSDAHTVDAVSVTSGGGSASITANQVVYDPGADYQHLALGETASADLAYTMSDNHGAESSSTVSLTITGTNDGPIAVADGGGTDEDNSVTIDVLANDTDADLSDTHTVDAVSVTSGGGTASIVGNQVVYDPGTDYQYLAVGETASVDLAYTMSDNHGAASSSTVSLTISGTNDGPIAVADSGGTDEDTSVTIDVLANDTDIDLSDTHSVDAVSVTSGGGSASIAGNQVVYDPGADYQYLALGETASVELAYTMSDSSGAQSSSTVSLTVTGTNDGPVAVADTGGTDEDTSVTIDVLANDTDADLSDTHTVDAVSVSTGGGSTAIVGNQVVYDPGADYQYLALGETASVALAYTMSDNHGVQSTATVSLTITGTNDGPVAVADSGGTDEDTSVTIDVLANDTDADLSDTHTVDAVSVTSGGGSASIVGNQVIYDPGADYQYLALGETASVELGYTMSDNHGAQSAAAVSLTITGTNDGPVAVADTGGTNEDTAITIDVLANDTDVDLSDSHTVDAVSVTSGEGFAAIAGNQVVYNPGAAYQSLAAGDTATVELTYTMSDNQGAESTSTVSLTITGLNDAPVAGDDAFAGPEDSQISGNVLANDIDIDNGDLISVVNAGTFTTANGGTVVLQSNGDFTYDPADDFNGTDSFDYGISDGTATDTAHVTLDVSAVNDGPSITLPTLSGSAIQVAVTYGNGHNGDAPARIVNQLNDSTEFSISATQVHYSGADSLAELQSYDVVLHAGSYYGDPMSADYWAALRQFVEADEGGVVTTGLHTYTLAYELSGTSLNDADFISPANRAGYSYEYQGAINAVNEGHPITDGVNPLQLGNSQSYYGARGIDADAVSLGYDYSTSGSYYNGHTVAYTDVEGLGNRAYVGGNYAETWSGNDAGWRTGNFDQLLEQAVNWAAGDTGGTDEDTSLNIAGIVISDVDAGGDDIQATFSVSNGSLALNSTAGLTLVDGDGSDGTLTVVGSQAVINAALANDLVYNPSENYFGTDTLSVTVDDLGHNGSGGAQVTTASVDISVRSVNDAPVARADGFSGNEDSQITGNVLTNDSDVENDGLSVANAGTFATVNGGTVTIQSNGDFTYNPAADFNGTDSFDYVLSDGEATDTATVTLNVAAVNDGPTITLPELSGGQINVAVTYGPSGSGGHPLIVNQLNDSTEYDFSATAVSYVNADSLAELSNYDVVVHAGYYYDPITSAYWAALRDYVEADEGGVVTTGLHSYTTTYRLGGTAQGDADFVSPSTAQGYTYYRGAFSLSQHDITDGISGLNSQNQDYYASRGADGDATVLGTFGGGVSVAFTEIDGFGNRVYLGGNYSENWWGDANYRSGGFDQLLEQAVNWAASETGGTDEDTPLTISEIVISDVDAGADPISATFSVSNGTLALNSTAGLTLVDGDGSDGTLTVIGSQADINAALANGLVYASPQDFNGVDSLTVTVDDLGHNGSGGAQISTTSVDITVNAVNDDPVAINDGAAASEDTPITITAASLIANDTDVDIATNGDTLSISAVGNASGGQVALDGNGDVVFTPNADYSGMATFDYTVSDGNGGTDTATVTVNVAAVADAPTVSASNVMAQGSGAIQLATEDEFQVNSTTANHQQLSNVITLEDGGFAVTWSSYGQDGSSWGVFGQRYDAAGNTVGNEFQVNTHSQDYQQVPSGAALHDGGFVITWFSNNQDGSQAGVYGQRYDAGGNPAGAEFQINTYWSQWQNQPSVATLNDGNFVVTWHSNFQDGSYSGVFAQHFDPAGNKIGGEHRLNINTYEDQTDPDITALADGGYVVAWRSYLQDGQYGGIFGRRFDANGNPVTGEFRINTHWQGEQGAVTISALTGGGFVATWSSLGQDGSDYGIYAQQFGASGNPVGGEFLVNASFTAGTQIFSDVEGLADGGYVISWQSWMEDGNKAGLMAQRYDASGNPVGDEFLVNDETYGDQARPSISARDDGGFVITWTSFDGQDGSGQGIFAKVYPGTSTGPQPVTLTEGDEFGVNSTTYSDQIYSNVTNLTDGGFVINWSSLNQDGSGWGVYGQRYDSAGNEIGGEFRVNSHWVADQIEPSATALDNGGFLITWHSMGQDSSGWGVYGQSYDAGGNTAGGEFQISTQTYAHQVWPDATTLSDGSVLVVWGSLIQDGSSYGIYGQRIDASGAKIGGEFQINTYWQGGQWAPDVAALNNGGFVVTWYSDSQDGSASGIYAQRYDAGGNPDGGEFLVNSTTYNYQTTSTVTGLADDGFVITWQSNGQDGSGYGVYGQRYDANGNEIGGEFRANTHTGNNQQMADVEALADGGFVVAWESYYQDGGSAGIFGQRFDSGGNTVDGEFQINDITAGDQARPSIAARDDGGFVVTWYSQVGDGSARSIQAKIYEGSGVSGPVTVALDVSAAVADTDGSESLISVSIAGIPDGATLSAGTDNGGGVWSVAPGDLSGLSLTLPTSETADYQLSVTAVSRETSNSDTASTTETFTVSIGSGAITTTPTFASAGFYGGYGDQRGTEIDVFNGSAYVSGSDWTSGQQSLALKVDLASIDAPTWEVQWPGGGSSPYNGSETFAGVAASEDGVFFAGQSYRQTTDTGGGKEVKQILVGLSEDGATGSDVGGADWVARPQTGGYQSLFAYRGHEALTDVTTSDEGGSTYIYAAGGGQPASYYAYTIAKFDAAGNMIAAATDSSVGIAFNSYYRPSTGGSSAENVMVHGGNVWVAGSTGWTFEDATSRPTLWRYDQSLNLVARIKDASLTGTFISTATDGEDIYAVGHTNVHGVGGTENYLIQKFDGDGVRQWSYDFGGEGTHVLRDVVSVDGRLFATGYTNSEGAGGYDSVLMEFDAETGALLSKSLYGGTADDKGMGISTDGDSLFIAGESKSFASAEGNAVDQNDVMVLEYDIPTGTVAAGDAPVESFHEVGNSGANTLQGGSGDDHIEGKGGNDTLIGGDGDDLFVFADGDGSDTINDFTAGAGSDDVIDLMNVTGADTFADVQNAATQNGSAAVINIGDVSITLLGVHVSQLDEDDFLL